MATAAVSSRMGVVARSTTDRHLLREFLEHDRLFAAYAICDLAEREFPRTRWGIATHGDRLVAVGMEYSGLTPQPMFVMGETEGIGAILRDVVRPRAAYIAAKEEALPAVAGSYKVDPGPQMIRMWVDRGSFQPVMARVERLLPVEVHELNRLYQLGFAAWLPSSAIAEGVYYGIRVNGRLVAAAGTHVISKEAGLAVVGNVLTHQDHRGRGYAKAVTSAVTAELLRACDQVVLNVRADNPPAIAAYDHLGYREHCRFEERLVRRTAPAWPDLVAPIRRLFAGWRGPSAPTVSQATPMPRFEQAHPVERFVVSPPVIAAPPAASDAAAVSPIAASPAEAVGAAVEAAAVEPVAVAAVDPAIAVEPAVAAAADLAAADHAVEAAAAPPAAADAAAASPDEAAATEPEAVAEAPALTPATHPADPSATIPGPAASDPVTPRPPSPGSAAPAAIDATTATPIDPPPAAPSAAGPTEEPS